MWSLLMLSFSLCDQSDAIWQNYIQPQKKVCSDNVLIKTKQTLQKKTVGFLPWEIIKKTVGSFRLGLVRLG